MGRVFADEPIKESYCCGFRALRPKALIRRFNKDCRMVKEHGRLLVHPNLAALSPKRRTLDQLLLMSAGASPSA